MVRRSALKRLATGALAGLAAVTAPRGMQRAMAQEAIPDSGTDAFIVVRRYQLLSADTMDLLAQRVTDGFLPVIRAIPGFREYLFVDEGNGAHMTISLFDDEEGTSASTANAADWAAANVRDLLAGPAEVTGGWGRILVTA